MAGTISIKATTIKARARSRGRVATSTRTLLRGVRDDAHPAQIMRVMSMIFPLLERVPAWYMAHGVRYDLLRIETRTINGVRESRAVFRDERTVRRSFAREMRHASRARRRAHVRAVRAEAHRRDARVRELIANAHVAHRRRIAPRALAMNEPMIAQQSPYLSATTPRILSAIPSGQHRAIKIWAASATRSVRRRRRAREAIPRLRRGVLVCLLQDLFGHLYFRISS